MKTNKGMGEDGLHMALPRFSLFHSEHFIFFFYASQRDSIILNVMSFKTKSKLETIKCLQLSNLGSWLSHGSLSRYSKAQIKARI